MMNVSDNMMVLVPSNGHNYHLFDDCYGPQLGQGWHIAAGHGAWAPGRMTVINAIENGKFACRICYKRAGLEIPAEADRVLIRAAARAERLERKAAKAAAKAAAAEPAVEIVEVPEVATEVAPAVTVDEINKMIADVMEYLTKMIELKASLLAA